MEAGRLRHKVTIQQPLQSRDANGAVEESWAIFTDDVPAEMKALQGRELLAAAAEHPEVTTKAVIRYLADVDTTMRVVHEGLAHNILAVLPDPTYRRSLTLLLSMGLRYDAVETVTIIDGGTPTTDHDDLIDGGVP